MTGKQLRSFRLSLGLTQVEFGEELGIKNPQIQMSQLEHGTKKITLRLEKAIAKWQEAIQLRKRLGRQSHGK